MKLTKLIVTGDQAHFKIPNHSKIQRTYEIPPISTVVGILQNIYGKDINDFTIGYFIEHKGINKEVVTIYKEVNINDKRITLTSSKRFTKDIIYVENLINPKLVIYTNINKPIEFKEPLTLGKANYLANIVFETSDLIDKYGQGYNQYTIKNIGNGMIKRINTQTKYNNSKGYYEYESDLFRENLEFDYDKYFDEDEQQNIFLWNWKDGSVYVK